MAKANTKKTATKKSAKKTAVKKKTGGLLLGKGGGKGG
jgi:hypothetical protein